MILLDALRNAPLAATSKRWPRVIHAVADREVAAGLSEQRTVTAVCGASRLRLVTVGGEYASFPPRAIAGLGAIRRCHRCWVDCGRPSPRRRRSITRRAP